MRPRFIRDVLIGLLGYTPLERRAPIRWRRNAPSRAARSMSRSGVSSREGMARSSRRSNSKGPGPPTSIAPMQRPRPQSGAAGVGLRRATSRGSRWVLVSNCLEIRLYGFGRGRDAYERFDLTRLDEAEEHERLWHILCTPTSCSAAARPTAARHRPAYRDITDELYGNTANFAAG